MTTARPLPPWAPPGTLASKLLTLLRTATPRELAELEAATYHAARELEQVKAVLRLYAAVEAIDEADVIVCAEEPPCPA